MLPFPGLFSNPEFTVLNNICSHRGPINKPMKLTAGFLSDGMKTLSQILEAGGLR